MGSQYDSELHRYIIGETRVDGFKSQWLLDWEQWQKDNPSTLKHKPAVKAPKPRVRYVAKHDYSGKIRQRLLRTQRKEKGLCTKCGSIPLPEMKSCGNCLEKQRELRAAA